MWQVVRRHEPNGHGGTRRSVDAPAPAVCADGMYGVGRHQVWLEDDGQDMSRALWSWSQVSYRDRIPGASRPGQAPRDFRDGPAPILAAGTIGGGEYWLEEDGMPEATTNGAKLPYQIPSMAEIAALRGTSGLRAVSTFSGCGGGCLGLEWAGFEVLWASEFIPIARETYEANHPGIPVDSRDIRLVQPEEILEACGGEPPDLMEGSPPCADFSTAGKRQAGWGREKVYSETRQRVDDLFFEYARLVRGVQPRAFIAENVSGLVKGTAKGYFREILAAFKDCGYRVRARVLDAQWLGVPQQRQRLIFVGIREDLGLEPPFPSPLPYRYTIADALPWVAGGSFSGRLNHSFGQGEHPVDQEPIRTIPGPDGTKLRISPPARVVHDTSGLFSTGDVTNKPVPTIMVGPHAVNSAHYQIHGGAPITEDPETGYRLLLEGHAIAAEYDKLRPGESSDRYFNLVRPSEAAPSPTMTQASSAAGGRRIMGAFIGSS